MDFFNFDISLWGLQKSPLVCAYIPSDTKYIQADARRVPFKEGSFDICLFRNPNWTDDFSGEPLPVVKEMIRVLKNGGFIWMTFFKENELFLAVETLKKFPKMEILVAEKNPFGEIRVGDSSSLGDSYILIARKCDK